MPGELAGLEDATSGAIDGSVTFASKVVENPRKEEKTMNYTKPEVSILGDAAAVIQLTGQNKKTSSVSDGQPGFIHSTPAYDLDE